MPRKNLGLRRWLDLVWRIRQTIARSVLSDGEIEHKLDRLLEYFNQTFPTYLAEEFSRIHHHLHEMATTIRSSQVAQQQDIDALTAEVTSLDQAVSDGFGAISTEVQNLVNAQTSGNPVDLSALQAAVGKAQSDVSQGITTVTGLVPAATDTSSGNTTGGTTTDTGTTAGTDTGNPASADAGS